MVYEMQRQDETFFHYLQYGIEGWQYVINEDGLRDEPEGYNPDTDGFASNIWGGRPEKFLIPLCQRLGSEGTLSMTTWLPSPSPTSTVDG